MSRQGTENAEGEGATATSGGVGDVLERELHEGPCRQNGDEGPDLQRNQQWATNYKEAAIFLEVSRTNFTKCSYANCQSHSSSQWLLIM